MKKRSLRILSFISILSILFISFSSCIDNPHDVTDSNGHSMIKTVLADGNSNAAKNPTQYSNSELENPNMYNHWVQYWGPWAQPFGGVGHGGTNWGGSNLGCVVTSIAIQTARAGAKKVGGKPFNPLTMTNGNAYAQASYKFDGGSVVENSTQCGSGYGSSTSHTLSDQDALAQCKKYADAGYYPVIRCGHTPTTAANHTVAYWKAGNGKPLIYDPARSSAGNWGRYWSYVGYLKITGDGIQKFNPNSPGPDDQVGGDQGSSSSSSQSQSGQNGQQNNSNQPAVKPIFNPFMTPTYKQVPADQVDSEQLLDNTKYMQLADGNGAILLSYVRGFMVFLIYLYAFIGIAGVLIKIVDENSGGILSDSIQSYGGDVSKSLLMPGGNLFGLEGYNTKEIIFSFVKKFGIISVILLLVASGTLSRAISWMLMGLTKIGGFNTMF